MHPQPPASGAEDARSSSHLIHAETGVDAETEVDAVVVGVGARRGVTAAEVLAAVDAVAPAARVTALATLDRRAAEPGVREAAASRGWVLVGLAAEVLAAIPVPSPSARVAAAVGTPSVAEAAALAGGGELVVPRTVVGAVTVAVVRR